MTERKRNLNLDLIRCAALLLVPAMHGIDNTGLYTIQLESAGDMVMMVLRILFTDCIPLYILLTGYLCNRKTPSLHYYLGYVRIYLTYLLCCIPSLLLEYYYKHSLTSISDLVGSVLNFYGNGYAWYIMMYTGLFIMIPFLNMMYHGCATKRQKQLLIAVFFALSILPSFLNLRFQIYSIWWRNLYPICYYFTGAYLSEYMPDIKAGKAGSALLLFLGAYSLFFFFYYKGNGEELMNVYQTSWEVYILGVLTFIFLYKLRLDRLPGWMSAVLIKISDLTLFIYLLTWIPDGLTYPRMVLIAPEVGDRYIWLLVTVPIALVSATLMALVMERIYRPLYSWIMKGLTKLLPGGKA